MPPKTKIINEIKTNGAINISRYMELCLESYYQNQTIFGNKGDFITAPEICQTFGEMLAIWILAYTQQINLSEPFILCEFGPGRGTLMFDIIRTILKLKPDFFKNIDIILIETSETLALKQQKLLQKYIDMNIKWLNNFANIPQKPIIVVANEFLDALPIEQYIFENNEFFLRKITINKNKFIFTKDNTASLPKYINDNLPQKAIIEESPTQKLLIANIAKHLNHYGGGALFIDYGSIIPAYGDTLQAIKNHKYINIFSEIGTADLTAHVNFYNLAKTAKQYNCYTYGTTQREFLINLGICERKKKLANHSINRLIDSTQMGNLFKVIAITPYSIPIINFTIENILI